MTFAFEVDIIISCMITIPCSSATLLFSSPQHLTLSSLTSAWQTMSVALEFLRSKPAVLRLLSSCRCQLKLHGTCKLQSVCYSLAAAPAQCDAASSSRSELEEGGAQVTLSGCVVQLIPLLMCSNHHGSAAHHQHDTRISCTVRI